MGTHIYFFDIFDGLIRTYRHEKNEYILINYHGEEGCHVRELSKFWNWWQDMASFKRKSDKVGFFIVSDKMEYVEEISKFEDIDLNPVSFVDIERSRDFINKMHKYYNGNIIFIYKDREESIRENAASKRIGGIGHRSNMYVTTYPQLNYEEVSISVGGSYEQGKESNPLREYCLSKQM